MQGREVDLVLVLVYDDGVEDDDVVIDEKSESLLLFLGGSATRVT